MLTFDHLSNLQVFSRGLSVKQTPLVLVLTMKGSALLQSFAEPRGSYDTLNSQAPAVTRIKHPIHLAINFYRLVIAQEK